ncbi:MAG: RNA-binding protein [Thermodesulfobacteriota bacterium]
MCKIFIGNLPPQVTGSELHTLFSPWGNVISCEMVKNRGTGKPRSYAFVEMTDEKAHLAIDALDGKDFKGRSLRVSALQGC